MSGKKIIDGLNDALAGRFTTSVHPASPPPSETPRPAPSRMTDKELESARLNAEAMDDQRMLRVCDELIQARHRSAPSWLPIETAPKDGTEIQAKIPGHGSDNMIAWQDGFMNSDNQPCACWVFTSDQEPPDSWDDGVCWSTNASGEASVLPTHWKLPEPPK